MFFNFSKNIFKCLIIYTVFFISAYVIIVLCFSTGVRVFILWVLVLISVITLHGYRAGWLL